MADEAAGGTEDSPPTAAGWVVLIMSFPRELRAGGAVAGAVEDIEEALQRAEGDLAVGRAFEGGGKSRLSWKITADAVLSVKAKPKQRAGREVADASWAAP